MKILVLFGGASTEYKVSLQSAHAVMEELAAQGHEVLPLGITRGGRWLRYQGDLKRIPAGTWYQDQKNCTPAVLLPDRGERALLLWHDGRYAKEHFELAFPVLHGKNGEDGTVQGILELAGIPFAGCGTAASALCMDKERAHRLAGEAGFRVPRSAVFERWEWEAWAEGKEREEEIRVRLAGKLEGDVFVKPVRSGSSFGITRVEAGGKTEEERLHALQEAIEEAFRHDGTVTAEEAIEGFEVGCAVIGNERLLAGEVDEIELSQGFFDFEEKYTLKTSAIHMPARLPEAERARIREIALKLYRLLGCKDFARVDLFYTASGEIVFNEINTIPGFTSHSRFPSMMKGIGLSFGEVLERVVAVDRQWASANLRYAMSWQSRDMKAAQK